VHTRRFLHSLTVVAAAAALSIAAHTTSVAAAEGDDGNGSRAPQWKPAAIHERRRDDDGARQSDVVFKPASASNVHAVPAVSPARSQPLAGLVSSSRGTVVARAPVAAARAQASAAPHTPPIGSPPRGPSIPPPNPPVLSVPPVPVAPPAFGPAVLRTQAPPLNLATIVTLAVVGAVALLAVFLARRPV
jgi:hypothetical protein